MKSNGFSILIIDKQKIAQWAHSSPRTLHHVNFLFFDVDGPSSSAPSSTSLAPIFAAIGLWNLSFEFLLKIAHPIVKLSANWITLDL